MNPSCKSPKQNIAETVHKMQKIWAENVLELYRYSKSAQKSAKDLRRMAYIFKQLVHKLTKNCVKKEPRRYINRRIEKKSLHKHNQKIITFVQKSRGNCLKVLKSVHKNCGERVHCANVNTVKQRPC